MTEKEHSANESKYIYYIFTVNTNIGYIKNMIKMKTRVIPGLLFFLLVLFIIACKTKNADQTATVIDSDAIKKEIQAKEDEFAETYNAGEMKNIGYYADDAITFSQNHPPLVGKPAIIEYLKANIDSLAKSNKISFVTHEVFVSNDGNQVVEIGNYRVVDADSNVVNRGNYMTLFVKRDGKYVSLRDMSASDLPND
jgi:ketosteroid isomerase-like protein